MTSLDDAFDAVPALAYTHHPKWGETVHRSDPAAIRRDITSLAVRPGDRVLEIGTGSGYSSAILASLCGPHGRVTSIDISDELVARATAIHREHDIRGVDLHVADGLADYPSAASYHRMVAWCAPPRLPRTWVDQVEDDGRIVACLPIAALPSTTLIATITVRDGRPQLLDVTGGGYAQSTATAVDDALTIPGRWVDYCDHQPDPSWISIAWRDDDPLRTGARAALDRLLHAGHTAAHHDMSTAWRSWTAYTAALGDRHVSLVSLRNRVRGIGHTTPDTAAVILADGTIIADTPHSPSLTILRTWLDRWETAGRPDAGSFPTTLVPYRGTGLAGWDLRVRMPKPDGRQ
ncbi:protein-L-isoaspartate O-methyltransferase family protein [Catenuloplanes indicus]|uniref:Protein-L-isoaspartate O-methyltransferase n=1 Tax=Catenuloplanes indicus TaxID=137267 RepID=A0AAE4AY78_9ACTN|nr:methyltransferase domain-containing protein [Catenuloplanes indicus]MDQ0366949.1 protein-L-isoaspartate(D-aspartate) O-methyltransferase [Catenuloplanes indicus]